MIKISTDIPKALANDIASCDTKKDSLKRAFISDNHSNQGVAPIPQGPDYRIRTKKRVIGNSAVIRSCDVQGYTHNI
jgi:hypothetical protein